MSKNKSYGEQLIAGIQAFKNDTSIEQEYSTIQITSEEGVLVRFFKFVPKKSSDILIPDMYGNHVKEIGFLDTVLTPIAKVLKDSSEHKAGDLVIVPFERVRGEVNNPEWQLFEQALQSKGVEAIEPEDKRRKIPLIEAMWRDYMFVRPWVYTPEEEDRITYLLPKYEIKTKWDLGAYLKTSKKGV